jgi:two-component system sensor histidine kinase/response regulator
VTAPDRANRNDGGIGDAIVDADQIESLRGMSESGENLLAVLVGLFLHDTPMRLATMRSAAEAGDAETLARAAHNLIGSAGNVGALRMVALCRKIDRAARAGDVTNASDMVDQLITEFALVETALREKVSSEAP